MNTDNDFITIKNYITNRYGIKFDENNIFDLTRNLSSICNNLNISLSTLSYKISSNTISKHEDTSLINGITIGETYFYRDSIMFDNLYNNILPKLISKSEPINILNVGCSTGEEPYTVAILLNKLLPDNFSASINIYGVDVNTDSIKKAKAGEYREWSFRDAPDWLKSKFFINNEDTYKIKAHIKDLVSFNYANITDISSNHLLGKFNFFDIIFCRNILIYLDKNIVNNILNTFYKLLKESGLFITSPGESVYLDSSNFKKYNNITSSVFCKSPFVNNTQNGYNNTSNNNAVYKNNVCNNGIKPSSIINKNYSAKKTAAPISNSFDYNKLLVLFRSNKFEQLVKEGNVYLDQFADINNTDKFNLYVLMGKVYYKTHQYELALKYFTHSLTLDTLSDKIYFYMGLVYQELGKYDLSKTMFQKALYLSPRDVGVLSAYSHLLHSMNDNSYKLYYKTLLNIPDHEIKLYKDDLYNID